MRGHFSGFGGSCRLEVLLMRIFYSAENAQLSCSSLSVRFEMSFGWGERLNANPRLDLLCYSGG
jgi:hypothetical protein